MQLGAELAGLLDIALILRIGEQQLPEISLADRVFHGLSAACELRQVKGVTVKRDHSGIALPRFVPLHYALLQDQECAAAVVQQFTDLGQYGDALVRVSSIVEKNAGELPVRASLANMDCHAGFDRPEAARLDNGSHNIRAHLGYPVAEHAQALGCEIRAYRADEQ